MTRTRLFLAVAALLGAAVAVTAIEGGLPAASQTAGGPAAAGIMTAPATVGDVEETVLASGSMKPVKLVAVGAQVSGRVTSVAVAVGDDVRAGDLVAQIDSVEQQNRLRTAQAQLANVRAQRDEKEALLAKARLTLERQRRLVAQRNVSQADFEAAEADVKSIQAQIAALDARIAEGEVAVEIARTDLGYTRITAPIDGTVLAVVTQQGQTVNAVQSAPTIVVLGQLDTMTVRAEISEADVVRVQPGQPVYFTILGDPDQRYAATLEAIEPAPESIVSDTSIATTSSASRTASTSSTSEAIYYIGVFHVPNPDRRLRTYMTAQVHFVVGTAKGVLTIPSAALGERDAQGRYLVQVMEPDGRTAPRAVEIGLNDMVTAEVRAGLREGERVVVARLPSAAGATPTRRGPPPPIGF
ncbi:efflux RND transporter periplasmic adaptor subunit [Azospirillum sp. ST 5-10]|uniref:efflux RND transporter periplasmic adaptor subunit n=1 Tax=unclassified Azospirillum TaxID=2630922 RepID=UPI003F4A6B72